MGKPFSGLCGPIVTQVFPNLNRKQGGSRRKERSFVDAVKLFDIVLTMHGLMSFDEEKKNSFEVVLGTLRIRVLDLDRIIKSKETVRRPKDLLVLPVLRDTLKTLRYKKTRQAPARAGRGR
jgi:uncharacterized protein YfaA (DUF2138 family)